LTDKPKEQKSLLWWKKSGWQAAVEQKWLQSLVKML